MQEERELWCAVVLRAFQDALGPHDNRERREARAWIGGTSNDFARVCMYAGIDAGVARERFRRFLDGSREAPRALQKNNSARLTQHGRARSKKR